MKSALLVVTMVSLVSCSSGVRLYADQPEFDWMPDDLLWQHNILNCRSQPQCDPASLFRRN